MKASRDCPRRVPRMLHLAANPVSGPSFLGHADSALTTRRGRMIMEMSLSGAKFMESLLQVIAEWSVVGNWLFIGMRSTEPCLSRCGQRPISTHSPLRLTRGVRGGTMLAH